MLEINQIYCMDCLDVLAQIDDESIDLFVTSPPYNIGIDYGVYKDNMKWEDYLEWVKKWISELYRVMKKDGRICINVLVEMEINLIPNNKSTRTRLSPLVEFYKIITEVGFKVKGMPMWTDNHRPKNTAWGSWKSCSMPYLYSPFEVIIIAFKEVGKKKRKA